MSAVRGVLLVAVAMSPACAVYESSLRGVGTAGSPGLDAAAGDDQRAGGPGAGSSAGGDASGGSGSGKSGAANGGSLSAAGSFGGGAAGSGPAPSAGAGGKPSGAGSGGVLSTGGTGAAGAGTAGAPAGVAGSPGGAGAPPAIDPCNRANWKASASESSLSMNPPQLYNPPVQAIDGTTNTRWSSGATQVGGEWFLVNLGAKAAHLTQVVLDTAKDVTDLPVGYTLELSTDGTNFTAVASGAGAVITTITFASTSAQYLRITQTGAGASWWTIHELSITCQ